MNTQHQTAPWTWAQPRDRQELLQRLADARDLNVNERERENLCAVAHGEIENLANALEDLVDDSYSLVGGNPALASAVYRCHQCEATKGDATHPHTGSCAVRRAEGALRHLGGGTGQAPNARETPQAQLLKRASIDVKWFREGNAQRIISPQAVNAWFAEAALVIDELLALVPAPGTDINTEAKS